jgi:hypothetical protein
LQAKGPRPKANAAIGQRLFTVKHQVQLLGFNNGIPYPRLRLGRQTSTNHHRGVELSLNRIARKPFSHRLSS